MYYIHTHQSSSFSPQQLLSLLWISDLGLSAAIIAYVLLAPAPYGFALFPWAIFCYLLATRKHTNASGLLLVVSFAAALLMVLPQLQMLLGQS